MAKTSSENTSKKANSTQVTQPVIKKADIGKLAKAILFGPLVVGIGVSAVYAGLWGISKAFVAVHSLVLAKVWPWVITNWWIIGLIWLIIAGSCCWFYAKDFAKTQKKAATQKNVAEKREQNAVKKTANKHSEQSIFSNPISATETKKDFEDLNYEAKIEGVLGHSCTPSPIFSAESVFGKKIEGANEDRKGDEPSYTFISEGPSTKN